ncbi:MAG: phage replisome organizer N-terminal domain-containing protein [Erysipelotrichaceae bacterium]|nr:phage replisome organizer N-terminal domain-containing protein [Erysipelotrichaceae bacterium]
MTNNEKRIRPGSKRYYWMRLKTDFFDQPEIKKLRRLAGGDTYTIIYLKMMLKTVDNSGLFVFQGIEDTFEKEVEEIVGGNIKYPSMINIVDFDKRMGIEECRGAVGFKENIKNVDLVGIYKNDLAKYEGIEFYPDASVSVYYVHPFQSNKYIEVFEYFKYLKEAKVAELEDIAQKLGAKHFSVKILEESLSNEKVKTKGGVGIGVKKDKAGIDVEQGSSEKKYEYVGIAAENTYPGKDPVEPKLVFWANNESIKSLVKQRLDKDNPITSKKFTLDYNTSSGIKEKDAAKIDGVLKVLKFKAAGSIEKEAQKESKRRFEYTIDF